MGEEDTWNAKQEKIKRGSDSYGIGFDEIRIFDFQDKN